MNHGYSTMRSWNKKKYSAEWHTISSPRPRKARRNKSKIKFMLIVSFNCRGTVHKEFVPQGQTVNQICYQDVFERLRKRVLRIRPEVANSWISHHDNALCYTSLSIREFLAKKKKKNSCISMRALQFGYGSLWLFLLFPKIKRQLKGHHYGTIKSVQKAPM